MIRISKLGFIPLFDFASLKVLKFLEKDTLLYFVCMSKQLDDANASQKVYSINVIMSLK